MQFELAFLSFDAFPSDLFEPRKIFLRRLRKGERHLAAPAVDPGALGQAGPDRQAAGHGELKKTFKGSKTEQAAEVGKLLAAAGKKAGVESVVFDRGGYLYHGRVKALADGAREGGLKF